MAEETFVFYKSKYFWKFINKQFDLSNMNDIFMETANEGDYTFLLAEQVPSNIYDCIDEDTGCLNPDANQLVLIDLEDVYSDLDQEIPYFNIRTVWIGEGEGGFTLELDSGDDNSVQINVGDSQNIYLQGMFLVKREASATGDDYFVMAYATIPRAINIRNFISVPFNGMIMGIGYCTRSD